MTGFDWRIDQEVLGDIVGDSVDKSFVLKFQNQAVDEAIKTTRNEIQINGVFLGKRKEEVKRLEKDNGKSDEELNLSLFDDEGIKLHRKIELKPIPIIRAGVTVDLDGFKTSRNRNELLPKSVLHERESVLLKASIIQ